MRTDGFDVESHKLPETQFLWHLLFFLLYWHNHCASDGLLSHCSRGWKNCPALNVKAILYNLTQPSLLGNLSNKTVAVAIQNKGLGGPYPPPVMKRSSCIRRRHRKQCKSLVVLLKSGLSQFLTAVECTLSEFWVWCTSLHWTPLHRLLTFFFSYVEPIHTFHIHETTQQWNLHVIYSFHENNLSCLLPCKLVRNGEWEMDSLLAFSCITVILYTPSFLLKLSPAKAASYIWSLLR